MLLLFLLKEVIIEFIFWYMNKDKAINIMKNSDLKKSELLEIFVIIYKMSEATYYKRNRKAILNRAKEYYENNKEVLREKARKKYRELSDEEKNIKREYGTNRYHNMSEEKKRRLKEYQKNYREANKSKKS